MQKLHFIYEMEIEYSVPVSICYYTIKCVPKDTRRQLIDDLSIDIAPSTRHCSGVDGFRNLQVYGVNDMPHNSFRYRMEGDATVGLSGYEEDENEDLDMVFKHPYGLNVAGPKIKEYYQSLDLKESPDKYSQAVDMMHKLYKDFTYEPCTTDTRTSAEEAFSQGKGVCQDYAHIFIALLHLAKIPARYVTGFIMGEGSSHAWVEVLVNKKWYGLDVTNDSAVGEDHIKIGHGRDANDCQINRGIMHGGGLHVQTINVNVRRMNDD